MCYLIIIESPSLSLLCRAWLGDGYKSRRIITELRKLNRGEKGKLRKKCAQTSAQVG
ncbi:Uncharacterised protein [Vibrio cholerae]|nr:Uncharacterised protein [Vibrio cholerae]